MNKTAQRRGRRESKAGSSRFFVHILRSVSQNLDNDNVYPLSLSASISYDVPADGAARFQPRPLYPANHSGHKIFPYLLRGLTGVGCADITYIPIGRGFLYLVAVVDWASRAVLAWRLSDTIESAFAVAALEEALSRFARPKIFNTNQGSQFTSAAFTALVSAARRAHLDGRELSYERVFTGPRSILGLRVRVSVINGTRLVCLRNADPDDYKLPI